MRLRNIAGADEIIANSVYVIDRPGDRKGHWREYWNNAHELHIEVGMGKGKFLMDMAGLNPQINYLGIERYSSVLLRAVQKMEQNPLPNLRFLLMDAKELPSVFGEGEVDRIYLNFSDPWPKDRHAKRRLPSRQFLQIFDQILRKQGTLEFKTDNRLLFDFAMEEIEPAGWELIASTYDLHKDEKLNRENVMTEYEEKFSSLGHPIYKYIIHREKKTERD